MADEQNRNEQKAPEMPDKLKAFNERRDKFKVNPPPTQKVSSSAEGKTSPATNEQKQENNSKTEEKALNQGTQEDHLKNLEAEADNFLNYEGDDPVSKIKKSYAHARRELTKKSQQSSNYEKLALKQKALLAKFDNLLKKDASGEYLDWDIPEKSSQQTQSTTEKVPEEPTEEELVTNYAEWKKKNDAYLLYKAKKESKEDRENEKKQENENKQKTEFEKEFNKTWEENKKISAGLFPDLVNEDSERFKRVQNIFRTDPVLSQTPRGNLYAAIIADWGLLYEEKNKGKQENKQENKEKNNFMDLPGGANKTEKSISKKDDMPDKIKAFKEKKLRFAVNAM